MEYTINSRKYKSEITFSRPGSSYVFVDLGGREGSLGHQICEGGLLMGETITAENVNQEEFETICKRWWAAFLRNER